MTGLMERNTLLRPRVQRHRRLKHAMDIAVQAEYISERARSHDLSAGGIFVDSVQPYEAGTIVQLKFHIDQRDYETRARIVYVKPQVGFGAQFLDFSADQRNRILQFVHRERATREAERVLRHDAWARMR